ncbi:MAG: Dabb family protein [Desulfobacula sp.]|nr:Dabb family protein [Desulfobacula sp.]
MIKHIVCWDITDKKNLKEHAQQVKNVLENLNGKIPGLLKIEVGFNYSDSETASDIVLYSEFESKEALASYITHPLHVEAGKNTVRSVTSNRRMIDYEV